MSSLEGGNAAEKGSLESGKIKLRHSKGTHSLEVGFRESTSIAFTDHRSETMHFR